MEFEGFFLLPFIVLQTAGRSTAHARCGASRSPYAKRRRVGAAPAEVVVPAVGAEEVIPAVPPAAEEVIPVPPAAEEVVPVLPAAEEVVPAAGGSCDNDDSVLRICFRETPSGKRWYKCPICLGEEYESSNKVLLHVFQFIADKAGAPPDVVELQHRQIARAEGFQAWKPSP